MPDIGKDGIYVVNLEGCKLIRTLWITLYINCNCTPYLDIISVENISKEIERFIRSKNIITRIPRIKVDHLIMYGLFYIGFVNFKLKGKTLTNLLSPTILKIK